MDHVQFLSIAFCILTISKLSFGVDTLFPAQTLADGEVLTSPGKMFELGFFSPGKSTAKFLGIWYTATPDVVVWVANRENPILDSHGLLILSENGTLILSSSQISIVWYSNSSREASSPVLQLLDTGNLVLLDNSSNIWQSFDYPGDTRLPGMKLVDNPDYGLDKHLTSWKSADDPSAGDFVYRIENHGLSQTSFFMGTKKRCRAGPWNGFYFTGLPLVRHQAFDVETVFNNGRLVSLSNHYNKTFFVRLTMNYSGLLQQYIMNEERNGWNLIFSQPSETCDHYGWCGPNSICTSYKTPVCECLRGFKPKSQKEWSAFTWTKGCSRISPLDCHKEDGFLEVERTKFPDPLNFRINTTMTANECHKQCLNNCSCTAYASPYLSNETSGCLMWFNDLIDVKEFTGDVSTGPSIYIRVPFSELEHTTGQSKRKRPARFVLVATIASLGMLVLCSLSIAGVIFMMRRRRQGYNKEKKDTDLPLFGLATIVAATNNFSDGNMIGEGGFGPVYKGILSDEQVVAIKRMSRTSGQGPEEFKNEVILIAKLQHRNLVRILGCCTQGDEKMLIYEYMQNNSLDYFIFDQDRSAVLTWPKRFDIIMGIARGLLYLHHDSRLTIIHRDLKTSNILLDENFNAKISDFGLARMFEGDQATARTKRVVGTYGYMAPEYAFDGKFSIKSDVFSMGVVILEIVSGKKNRGFKHHSCYHNLLEQAWLLWKDNRALELTDPCYISSCVESQVKRCIQVGLLCVQNVADERPVMSSVLLMLSSEDTVLAEPKKPAFFLHTSSSSFSETNASGSEESRSGSITITQLEAR